MNEPSASCPWAELSDAGKIERLREQVKALQDQLRYVSDETYRLKNKENEYF